MDSDEILQNNSLPYREKSLHFGPNLTK